MGLGRAKYGGQDLKLVGLRADDGLPITLGVVTANSGRHVEDARARARTLLDSTSRWSRIDIMRGGKVVAREFKRPGRERM